MAKENIYHRELENLEQSKKFLQRAEYSKMDIQLEYKRLVENYEELVGQVQIITKISDRLQNKLDKTNEMLEKTNEDLHDKNIQLIETIDALTEAKIGRKAATIVMILAIVLFIVSEAVIEPAIEREIDNWWIGLGLKFVVAILIKPGEDFINKYMLKKARKKQLGEQKVQVTK